MIILHDFRVRQRDFLLQISRAITAQLDLNEVLRLVLEASSSMLSGEVGLVALRAPNNQLTVQAVFGVDADKAEIFDTLLDLEIDDTGQIDADALKMRTRLVARKLNMELRQVVSLPMQISGEILGIIFVFRAYPGAPTLDDHMILQSFADQAAIAVHNAGLYQAVTIEKQRLAAILDGSGDGIIILDSALRVMRLNPALGRITGWKGEYALGRYHNEVIRWKKEPDYTLEKALQAGWPQSHFDDETLNHKGFHETLYVEGNIERLDGMKVSVGITYAPLFFDDGSLRNIIANVRDITRIKQADEIKNTFVSIISHELKTPVALIKGYAGTLLREDANWDTATIRRGLTIIEEEADRLTELIENLLTASRLQVEGMMQLDMDDVALDSLARQSVERFRTQTQIHDLRIALPEDFPIVRGDARRLRQVIDNLVSNAIKYSPQGGVIIIGGDYDDEVVKFWVQDQGEGFTEEDAPKLFDRFFRSENAIKSVAPGTGLGLYLARAVIEAHGGRIWATGKSAQGATFTFTLPRNFTTETFKNNQTKDTN